MNSFLKSEDVHSGTVVKNSCRSGWGSAVECLVACELKEKKEDVSNCCDRLLVDTLRIPAMQMDIMCMSK